MSSRGDWRRNRVVRPLAVVVILGLLAAGAWQLFSAGPGLTAVNTEFKSILGVNARVIAVVGPGQELTAQRAIQAAAAQMVRVEALVSTGKPQSEISLFNATPADRIVQLSPMTMEMLRLARQYATDTGGAFDVTCQPLLVLWAKAREQGRMPTDQEITQAHDKVGWDKIELLENGARKKVDGAGIELAGISRGYAMDLAVEAMRQRGAIGGMVNLGDDYRVFGRCGKGDEWLVPIRNPFGGDKPLATLRVRESAVCTRSNYDRSWLLGTKRLGRMVDPRTGMPADLVPSVTVVGERAIHGVWATAMSVTGPNGMIVASVHAPQTMMVTGDKESWRVLSSPEFDKLLETPMAKESAAPAPANGAKP
jgi:thiamine biosynthesis lipoprotein